jgi:hypothetical protein
MAGYAEGGLRGMAVSKASMRTAGWSIRRCMVLDLVFVGVPVLFFVVSIGYVAACERLMK